MLAMNSRPPVVVWMAPLPPDFYLRGLLLVRNALLTLTGRSATIATRSAFLVKKVFSESEEKLLPFCSCI
jgi:hypothetical protein